MAIITIVTIYWNKNMFFDNGPYLNYTTFEHKIVCEKNNKINIAIHKHWNKKLTAKSEYKDCIQ